MNAQKPTDEAQRTIARFATGGAFIGAGLGVALTLLLRNTLGPTEHYLIKSFAIVVIVACFGGFVGVLAEAFLRSRRG